MNACTPRLNRRSGGGPAPSRRTPRCGRAGCGLLASPLPTLSSVNPPIPSWRSRSQREVKTGPACRTNSVTHSFRPSGRVEAVGETTLPAYSELLWPTVQAVRRLGGSASIDEIVETVVEQEEFTDAQQQVLHGDGPQTEIEYRLAWARTYLKGMGLLVNSRRGVWSLTEEGRSIRQHEIAGLHKKYTVQYREVRRKRRKADDRTAESSDDASVTAWQDQLLDALMTMRADAFERLAQRLLREAGFINATVTGRTGDGGIDGLGVYRMSLVSFPVFFQCKRYKGSVGSAAVRDFRGAMTGRGDKGLLIRTGTLQVRQRPRPRAMGHLQST